VLSIATVSTLQQTSRDDGFLQGRNLRGVWKAGHCG